MGQNLQLDFQAFLADHPVFTLGELARGRGSPERREEARNQLRHHLRSGRVKSVAKGLYAAVPPGISAAGFDPDRYQVAATARPAGVFAYHAALELLGIAQSVWSECTLFSARPRRPIDLQHARIVFLPLPAALRRAGADRLGVQVVTTREARLAVTGPERVMVEGLRRPRWVGGLHELIDSIESLPGLDFDTLERVLEAYDQRTLWAAVGWLCLRNAEIWQPPESFLARCRAERPASNQYLVAGGRGRGGEALRDWHLIVPPGLDTGFEGHRADA